MGLPKSVNDSRELCRSSYKHAQFHNLFGATKGAYVIPPYLLGDKGYPLSNWIMTPFKEEGQHIILQLFYNRIHKKRSFYKFFWDI
jgi:hypothetical protein